MSTWLGIPIIFEPNCVFMLEKEHDGTRTAYASQPTKVNPPQYYSMEPQKTFKKIGLVSAIFINVSAMIGSGWLFAPYLSAKIAGGGAIIAWLLAAVIIFLLGMIFSEIAGLYPKRGLMAIVPTLTHNSTFAFPFSISAWLGLIAVVSLEATASIEYLVEIFPNLEDDFYKNDALTVEGTLLAIGLIAIYSIINYWGAQLLSKVNNLIVIFKLIVPAGTAILILATAFHAGNFTAPSGEFIPNGFSSILTAILTAGLIVSLNGFQVITGYSSEIENPRRNIPLAIGISVFFVLIVYLLLQICFIGALPPEMVAKGWDKLDFAAPMVQLSGLVGLGMMTIILYTDAAVSPMGTAVTDLGASSRMFTAMARKKQMPQWFDKIDPKAGISRRSLYFNILLSVVFLLIFHSWELIAEVLGLLHVISYLPITLALVIFRRNIDKKEYGFRLPLGTILAPLIFCIFCYLFTVVSFSVALTTLIMLGIFQLLFIMVNSRFRRDDMLDGLSRSGVLGFFFTFMLVLNYISPSKDSGIGILPFLCLFLPFTLFAYSVLTRLHLSEEILAEFDAMKHE